MVYDSCNPSPHSHDQRPATAPVCRNLCCAPPSPAASPLPLLLPPLSPSLTQPRPSENATGLLSTINGFVRDSWPVIATATNAELDSLPLVDHQVTQAQRAELSRRTAGGRRVDIKLEHPGPLGLHLDINEKRGFIRVSAWCRFMSLAWTCSHR